MTTIPTPITDKNGKNTTVHKKPETKIIDSRAFGLPALTPNANGLPTPKLRPPTGAAGLVKYSIGYEILSFRDKSLTVEIDGVDHPILMSGRGGIKGVRDEIDNRLANASYNINRGGVSPEENATLSSEIATLTTIRGQLESPEEIKKLEAWAKAAYKVQESVPKMKLHVKEGFTAAEIHAIERYGDEIVARNPGISGYDRDVMLTEALAEYEPKIVDTDIESDNFPDYVHDIGVMYIAMRDERKKDKSV